MNELKPVAMIYEDNSFVYSELVDRSVKPGTALYAIPDTHRVVSVSQLARVLDVLRHNQAFGDAADIRAIIDNKEQKE